MIDLLLQIILFCALAKGKSRFLSGPITLHTETCIHFVEMFTGAKFQVTKTPGSQKNDEKEKTFIIECDGIGLTNKNFTTE